MSVVRFENVAKTYGSVVALRDVSFEIGAGEIVAMLGPNGAGKTTAIEILLGLRRPSAGSVRLGNDIPSSPAARRRIGATPQNSGFPDALRVGELIELAAVHYPHPRSTADVLKAFELGDLASKRVGDLSGGQQRRVALALAFAGNPELVVLDEPTTGLDAESRRRLWTQLRASVDERRTVLFTTHYLEEAEALATRILVLAEGTIRFDGTPAAFRAGFSRRRIDYVGADGRRVLIASEDTDAYVRSLVRENVAFSDLLVTQPSFEDVFLHLTGAAK